MNKNPSCGVESEIQYANAMEVRPHGSTPFSMPINVSELIDFLERNFEKVFLIPPVTARIAFVKNGIFR
jgi:hypothetical protein